MATAENARLDIESGQTFVPMEQLTNSGDNRRFDASNDLFSAAANTTITVRVDGLTTGGEITPNVGTNNGVSVAAAGYNLAGSVGSLVGANVVAQRGSGGNTHRITSITITSAGALAAVAGTEGSAFTEARGVAGGPPLIPVGSIEIGQVRLTSITAADVAASEIFTVTGQHVERSTSPIFTTSNRDGRISFISPLPAIHVGEVPRGVYAEYFTPVFAEISDASAFVPPEESDSSTSTQVYGRTVSATSTTLNQGTFSALLQDGITDSVVQLKGQTLWFRFFPNRFSSNNLLTQGRLGIARTFPADGNITAACTITASETAEEVVA